VLGKPQQNGIREGAQNRERGVFELMIRTIGLARVTAAVTRATMAGNMKRCCWRERRSLPA
jgi:hypothetical protein